MGAVGLIAVLALCLPAAAGGAGSPSRARVEVFLTSPGDHVALHRERDVSFTRGGAAGASVTVSVDPRTRYQRITGFGAAFTDSSLYLLSKLPRSQRLALLRQLLRPAPGLGLSVMRVPIAASDFTASGMYSYDDLPAGSTDPSLRHFSIAHDRRYVLPILREALRTEPRLRIIANPWSPPAWMKTNDSMTTGADGTLLPSAYEPLAHYFVRFLEAYRAAGVPVWAITPQNEPLQPTTNYPGMFLTPSQEATFVSGHLVPALRSAHLHPRIYAYDYTWAGAEPYVSAMFSNPAVAADFSGVAYHCYFGAPESMASLHTLFPRAAPIEDECSTGISVLSPIQVLLRSVDNGAGAALMWNVALDPSGGPKIGTGCLNCIAQVTIDPATHHVAKTGDYYQLGQVAGFVRPGAARIAATTTPAQGPCANAPVCGLETAAFRDPGGRYVLVATNSGTSAVRFAVKRSDGSAFTYSLPGQVAPSGTDNSKDAAVVTFVWNLRSARRTPSARHRRGAHPSFTG